MQSETRGPSRRKYQAAIRDGRRVIYLGMCDTPEQRDALTQKAREERRERRAQRDDDFLDEDPFAQNVPDLTGEMRLCAAVMLQAARDLRGRGVHRRRAARLWVLSDEAQAYSFTFCCDVLGRGVEETRERLLAGRSAWQRKPSTPLTIVRKDSAQN